MNIIFSGDQTYWEEYTQIKNRGKSFLPEAKYYSERIFTGYAGIWIFFRLNYLRGRHSTK